MTSVNRPTSSSGGNYSKSFGTSFFTGVVSEEQKRKARERSAQVKELKKGKSKYFTIRGGQTCTILVEPTSGKPEERPKYGNKEEMRTQCHFRIKVVKDVQGNKIDESKSPMLDWWLAPTHAEKVFARIVEGYVKMKISRKYDDTDTEYTVDGIQRPGDNITILQDEDADDEKSSSSTISSEFQEEPFTESADDDDDADNSNSNKFSSEEEEDPNA